MKLLLVWKGAFDAADRAIYARRQVPLLRALRARGVRIALALAGDDGGLRQDLRDTGIEVEVLPALPPPPRYAARMPRAIAQLRRFVRAQRPDIVEASDPMPGFIAAFARAGLGDHVFIYRRHFDGGRWRAIFPSWVAARLADRMIASCESMRRITIAKERKAPALVDVATSGIEDPPRISEDERQAARASLGIGAQAVAIVVVAYLRRQKGRRCAGARDVGTGGGRGNASDRGGQRARSADAAHAGGALAGVGAFPRPSRRRAAAGSPPATSWRCRAREEAFGRVTLEVMAAGKPLVASAVGGLPDAVVDGETGLLVPPDDPAALAAALRRLAVDRALRERLGAAARARFEAHYTIDHMAASWHAAWCRALAAHAPSPRTST